MNVMTMEDALSKCKIYDGTDKSLNVDGNRGNLAGYEKNFVNLAQTKDGVEYLSQLEKDFKASPARQAMAVSGGAYEPFIAMLWGRYKYWSYMDADEAELAESFTKMIAKDYN